MSQRYRIQTLSVLNPFLNIRDLIKPKPSKPYSKLLGYTNTCTMQYESLRSNHIR